MVVSFMTYNLKSFSSTARGFTLFFFLLTTKVILVKSRVCRTHLGKPIHFPPEMSPEDVKKHVKEEVHDLIRAHQRLPGSIFRGIVQRYLFCYWTLWGWMQKECKNSALFCLATCGNLQLDALSSRCCVSCQTVSSSKCKIQ